MHVSTGGTGLLPLTGAMRTRGRSYRVELYTALLPLTGAMRTRG